MLLASPNSFRRALSRLSAAKAGTVALRLKKILGGADERAVSRRTALFIFGLRLFNAAIAYFSQVLLARWLGEYEYGIFVAVWVGVLLLGGISCFGMQVAIVRLVSEYLENKDFGHLRGIASGSVIGCFVVSSLLSATGAAVIYSFSDILASYYVIPVLLAAFCIPIIAVQEIQAGIARAFDLPVPAMVPTFVLRPLLIIVVVAILLGLGFAPDARIAVVAAIAASWLACLVQTVLLYSKLSSKLPATKRQYDPRKWLVIAMPIFLVEGFYSLLTSTDILFVGYFMPPDKVAIYYATAKTLALVQFVYFAVRMASAHRFAAYRAAGDTENYERFVRETIHWTFWPSLAFALLMVAFGKYFLALFGPAFLEGQKLLWILAIGIVFRSGVGAAESVLTMSGRQNACALVYGLTFSINATLNYLLIPRYGLIGAASATSAAMVFEAVALYIAARHSLGLHIFILPAPRIISAGAAS